MENSELFELMTKMYTEMQSGFKNVDRKFDSVNDKIDGLQNETRKNSIKLEELNGKISTLTEVV